MTSRNRKGNPAASPNNNHKKSTSSWRPHSNSRQLRSNEPQPMNIQPQSTGKTISSTSTPCCSWDKQNLSAFQSLRSQMLSALLDKDGTITNNINSYTRSQSTSAVPTTSFNKDFVRARSTMPSSISTTSNTGESKQELTNLLPTNTDYIGKSIHLLFDTPLPLSIENNKKEIQIAHLRKPHPEETIYILSRVYLRTWFDWARNTIVNSQVSTFHQLESSSSTPKTFRFNDNTLRILASLSILSEQYQLWEKGSWTRWFTDLENHWKRYCERLRKVSHLEEKKEDEMHDDGFLPTVSPGAVDGRLLSCRGHPLLLRRNVSLAMGEMIAGDEDHAVLSVNEEMREEMLIQFLARDEEFVPGKGSDGRPRMAVCPVSSSFYEWTQSTLGVLCDDGTSISFQPGSKSQNRRGGGIDSSSLLYHEQSSNLTAANKSSKDVDIPHPCSQSSSVEAMPSPLMQRVPRPIEFQRRILTTSAKSEKHRDGNSTPTSAAASSPNKKMSSYSKLMKEAMTSRKEEGQDAPVEEAKSCTVEVHPVEFRYVVVDAALPGSSPVNKPDSKPAYSANGIALLSRVSRLSDALNEFKRVVECNRSSACVRLWRKSPCAGTSTQRGATVRGDGYDLIDVALLDGSEEEGLTVEKWLRLDDESRNANSGPEVVEILVEIRSSPSSRWVREPLELENRLQVGDFVDAQDTALNWYEGVVRELTPETVKVHYFGWGSRWDGELPRRKGGPKKISPPMPLWSKTSRWRERIRVGQEVEVRQTASHAYRPKWYRAEVIAVRRESDIAPLEITGGAELELIGEDTKSPLKLLQRKRQVLVRVPQERNNCTTPVPEKLRQENGLPVVHPPFIRWVDLYGEEICEANTHINFKKQSDAPATVTYAMDSQRKQPVEVMKSFNNLHGSGFVRESLRGVPPAPGSVGLHNLGNSCYMNSILQCVNHISPITQYFLKGEYVKHVNKNNPLGSGGRVATAYASFLSEIWTGEYSILAPRTLKQTVGFFAPQFNNNYQHDSQEFCQYLMDGLHEDLNRVKEKPYVEHIEANGMKDEEAAIESWKRHLLRHDSVFVDYTQGMHRSHLTCPSCGKESIKFDVYSSISLPLVPSKNGQSIPLKDCLDQFAMGEQLDEHNAWYCSRCKKHVCALKLITLWNTPDILVLHLKRFTFEKCPTHDGRLLRRKIEDRIDFPIDKLDLSSYILGPKHADAPPIYKLFGVSEHMGSTANSGHYTATVRNSKDGNWYRYNDSHVGSTSGDAAVTGGAYLLFYQREKGSLRWAGMERQMQMGGQDADGFTEVQGKKKKKN